MWYLSVTISRQRLISAGWIAAAADGAACLFLVNQEDDILKMSREGRLALK